MTALSKIKIKTLKMLAAICIIIFGISSKIFPGILVTIFNNEIYQVTLLKEHLCKMLMKRQVNVTIHFKPIFKIELNKAQILGQVKKSKGQRVKQTWVQDPFLLLLSCTASDKLLPCLYTFISSAMKCQLTVLMLWRS